MNIEYKNIRHGYARIDKEGNLLITIPFHQKGNKKFEQTLISKGQLLLNRYNKRTHIAPIQENSILLFGEQVPIKDFYKQYNKKGLINFSNTISHVTYTNFHFLSKILKQMLSEYATPLFDLYSKKLGIPYKKFSIRKTTSKRGSCTHNQKISLNRDLIHLPTKYIKYVIIHEACHLKIKNHSKKFRALVEHFCPNYKEIRKELKKIIIK